MRTDPITLNPAGRTAIKAFRDAKPWQGTVSERCEKFLTLHTALIDAYDLDTALIFDDERDPTLSSSSGSSGLDRDGNLIVLRGRLSVVTYLFLFALAVGAPRAASLQWAHTTFKHFFPRSYRGCRVEGGLIVRDETRED